MEVIALLFVPILPAAFLTVLLCRYRLARGKQVSWGTLLIGPCLATILVMFLAVSGLWCLKRDAMLFTRKLWSSPHANPLGDLYMILVVPTAMATLPALGIVAYYQWRMVRQQSTSKA